MSVSQASASATAASLERDIDDLPVLPTVVAKLLALDPKDDNYFRDVVSLVEKEPNYAALLISAANSARFGMVETVARISDAVIRLGTKHVRNLVVAMSVVKAFTPRDDWERSLWVHTFQVAAAARKLAQLACSPDLDPETAYLSGLLHDLGRFLLFQKAPDVLREVDEGDWHKPEELVEIERSICGLTHTELGGLVCEKWGIPDQITQAVRWHHEPNPEAMEAKVGRLVTLIRLADVTVFSSGVPGDSIPAGITDLEILQFVVPKLPKWFSERSHRLATGIRTAVEDAQLAIQAVGL